MSTFEIEGVAKREVACDMASITITFRAEGNNAYDASQKVMAECDEFLGGLSNIGVDINTVKLSNDIVQTARFDDSSHFCAEREIVIRTSFDVKKINYIQTLLQKGKYDYELDVESFVSKKSEICIELSKEALEKSRKEAEQIAEVLGIKVQGAKTINKQSWGDVVDIENCLCEMEMDRLEKLSPRTSDNLGAPMELLGVRLMVKWILE